MTEPTWADLAAAYVLGALEPDEIEAFEKRLAEDPALQNEVRNQRELLGLLADAAPPMKAPPGLRERILSQARASAPPARAGDSRDAIPLRPRAATPIIPWFVAAAAAVAALALGISNRQISRDAEAIRADLGRANDLAAERAAALATRDSLLRSFLGPDVRSATLASTGAPPAARIFYNAGTGSVVIAAFDLPPAPAGRIYQLWGIPDGGDPVSLGTFQTDLDGTVLMRTAAPVGSDFTVGAVTEEPAGGSPQPTTTPFLVGTWASP